jgi:hypothetical protein
MIMLDNATHLDLGIRVSSIAFTWCKLFRIIGDALRVVHSLGSAFQLFRKRITLARKKRTLNISRDAGQVL